MDWPAAMNKKKQALSPQEKKDIDDFVYPQVIAKNERMRMAGPGIHIMDRAPLDLFAFSDNDAENKVKATELKGRVTVQGSPLADGQIIFLRVNKNSLEERLERRGYRTNRKNEIVYTPSALLTQEKQLRQIYHLGEDDLFDTTNLSVMQIARTIARMVLLDKYVPFQFASRIDEIITKDGAL